MDAEVLELPRDAICPISQHVMEDPVVCADGHSYERKCIQEWFARGHRTSPKTNDPLPNTTLIPNISLRNTIEELTQRMPTTQRGQVILGRVQLRQNLGQRLDLMEDLSQISVENSCDDVGQEPPHYIPGRATGSSGGFLSARGVHCETWEPITVNDFRNQQRRGVKPSGPQLNAYARYLGINTAKDNDLLWIALESIEAPLPAHWSEHYDNLDRVFYFNAVTHESRWRHPLEQIYRDAYQTISLFRHSNMSQEEHVRRLDELRREARTRERNCQEELSQWTEHVDEDGNRFYFNYREQQSTWTDPRPSVREALNLRLKALGIAALAVNNQVYTPRSVCLSPQLAQSPRGIVPRLQDLAHIQACHSAHDDSTGLRLPSRPGPSSRAPSQVQTPQPSPRQNYWDEFVSVIRNVGATSSPKPTPRAECQDSETLVSI